MDCEAVICPDMVGATIEIHETKLPEKHCDNFVTVPAEGLDGCAVLNLTTGVCTIYIERHYTKEVLRHELGHCHGWSHNWNPQRRRYEWFRTPETLQYSIGDRRPIESPESPAAFSRKPDASP